MIILIKSLLALYLITTTVLLVVGVGILIYLLCGGAL